MKRHIKRLADILRVTGIVLICIALVLSIYITASIHKPWGEFQSALNTRGVQTNFGTRLGFDGDYYAALSQASAEKGQDDAVRAQHARAYFADYEAQAVAAEQAAETERTAANWAWFDNAFDSAAFLEAHAQAEGTEDARMLSDIFDALDALAPAPGKGKAAKLKAASVAPFFEEAYAAFVQQSEAAEAAPAEEPAGEGDAANDEAKAEPIDTGSYLEYMLSAQRMINTAIEGGETIKDVKAWWTANFTPEAYAEVLAAVRTEERVEAAASVSDQFADAIEAGTKPSEALKAIWQDIHAQKPALNEADFAETMQTLLFSETFDGSVKSIETAMAPLASARESASFSAYMENWSDELVKEADNRSLVRVIAVFWWVVSRFIAIWIIGIALVILGVVIEKLLVRHMIRKIDHSGIQEDPDVLLRVEHLCQYFRSGENVTKAVDDVSFFVKKGEVFGLVGESGCGKTTTGRTIINLYDPTSGDVYFDGLRISSGKNGLPVLRYTLRRDTAARIDALKSGLKEQIRLNPANAAQLKAKCKEEIRETRRELSRKLIDAQNAALEAEAEKSKATQFYRQLRKEQLTKQFEDDAKNLSGAALEDRKRRLEVELKAASRDNVMTRMQMIFQDPIASIDPRMTVREIIAEGLHIRGIKDKKIIDQKVYEMLDLVGLVSEHADRYPHEFSGGQRQRIGIARAIALEPEMIIADEPISALDVSIQAQVINLLNDLRNRMGLTIIFIAHNLSVVKYFSDRIAVMYFGNLVEMTTSDELFEHPLHPYTKSLLSAIPYPDPHYEKQRKRLRYEPAKEHDYSVDKPSLREITPGHWIRCNDAELAKYRKELGL